MNRLGKLNELSDSLGEYAKLANDEYGELSFILISLAGYYSYMSDEFVKALISEMELCLSWFSENTEIVEKEVVETTKYKDLEYKC